MDRPTSDEKLLKLIEGTAGLKPKQKIGLKPKRKGILPFPLKFKLRLNLQNVNKGLLGICGLLTIACLFTVINGTAAIRADLIFPSQGQGPSTLTINGSNRFSSLQEYRNEIDKRNIFMSLESRAAERRKDTISPELEELVKDLKLVGVIWSKRPEVMIENTKENRTYLLKKGDTFGQPQLRVKDITHNAAVLEMESEGQVTEYELR